MQLRGTHSELQVAFIDNDEGTPHWTAHFPSRRLTNPCAEGRCQAPLLATLLTICGPKYRPCL
ncbi:hypothetical protein PsYK624_102830 [Phanerochaete sordida]|uniref:Uncharacterized protein n=1 Tax=Phanerochaete sordida TaxID=48140 RepID=A0A9P3GFU1_9APHY|nr:hypothetical protein PsYK624_102830 [Phanerochaete sordida]